MSSPYYSLKTLQGRLILVATILASAISFLLSSAMTVALPVIQSEFNATLSDMQWVMNAYALVVAVFLLISGSLGDRYGRKRIFSLGIVTCIAGSIVAGFSFSIDQLIVCQSILGIGSAMMIPGSLAIINASFVEQERGQAIGLWAGLSAGISALGPFLGGVLIESFGWSSIFYLNIPLGFAALWITLRFVPESKNPEAGKLDWLGTFWITIGLFGVSFGLIQAPIIGWYNPLIWITLIGGLCSMGIFILVEARVESPMVPLRIFHNPLVAGANLVTFFLYFSLYGLLFFLVINLQQFQGYTPALAGAALIPPILIITFFSGSAGSLSDRIGPRLPMIIGSSLVGIGMVLLMIPGLQDNFFTHFLPGLLLFGGGMALLLAPLTKSALSVEDNLSGIASGINNAVSRTAALMAITILGAMMVSIFTNHLEIMLRNSSLSLDEQQIILNQAGKLGNIEIPSDFDDSIKLQVEEAINSSFLYGFRFVIGVSAFLCFVSTGISFLTIQNKGVKALNTRQPDTKTDENTEYRS